MTGEPESLERPILVHLAKVDSAFGHVLGKIAGVRDPRALLIQLENEGVIERAPRQRDGTGREIGPPRYRITVQGRRIVS